MDLLEHLTNDHRKAESLLTKLAQSHAGPERDQTLAEFQEELSTHMAVEEQFLYPILAQVIGTEPEYEAETEHGLTREGLARLNELASEPGFGAAVAMLQGGIGHHIEEEEHEIFPKLRWEAPGRIAGLDPRKLEERVRSWNRIDGDFGVRTRRTLQHASAWD